MRYCTRCTVVVFWVETWKRKNKTKKKCKMISIKEKKQKKKAFNVNDPRGKFLPSGDRWVSGSPCWAPFFRPSPRSWATPVFWVPLSGTWLRRSTLGLKTIETSNSVRKSHEARDVGVKVLQEFSIETFREIRAVFQNVEMEKNVETFR